MNQTEDIKKSREEIFTDIYKHSKTKTELNKNMLASMYAEDPIRFSKDNL